MFSKCKALLFTSLITLLPSLAATADTAAGFCPLPEFTSDGCTGVPEGHFYENTFFEACKSHDICYGQVGTIKTVCDSNFKKDMESTCARKYGGGLRPDKYLPCMEAAKVLHAGVELGGAPFFSDTKNAWRSDGIRIANDAKEGACAATPTSTGMYGEDITNTMKDIIRNYTGESATAFQLFNVLNSSPNFYEEADYFVWLANTMLPTTLDSLIGDLPSKPARYNVAQSRAKTQITAADTEGSDQKLYVNGASYNTQYIDSYSATEQVNGGVFNYAGFVVRFDSSNNVLDYKEFDFKTILNPESSGPGCGGQMNCDN